MPEYEKDTLYRPETKKSGSLAYKIGQAIAKQARLDQE